MYVIFHYVLCVQYLLFISSLLGFNSIPNAMPANSAKSSKTVVNWKKGDTPTEGLTKPNQ